MISRLQAKKILQDGKFKQLVDPCLGTDYSDDQMERMILAASLCIRRAHRSRPTIATVRSQLPCSSHNSALLIYFLLFEQ